MQARLGGSRLWWGVFHLLALTPLFVMVWAYYTNNLTYNPIREITFRTGRTALLFLIGSLAATPVSTILGWPALRRFRRPLGLYAFLYALLHFLTFVGLDYSFNWALIRGALFENRYALVGLAAFALLVPLAITSTGGWIRRLGGRRWRRLHRLVYVAALLAVLHYVWLVKADIRVPLAYGAVVVILLLLRLPFVRQGLSGLGARMGGKGGSCEGETRPS